MAQSAMLQVCRHAGLNVDMQLADDLPAPLDGTSFGLATDDIVVLSRDSEEQCRKCMARVDRAFSHVGIQRHPQKDVTGALSGQAVGVDLKDGLAFWVSQERLRVLMPALLEASASDQMSPAQVAILLGHVQWLHLLNRPLLCCLNASYLFARREPQL